MKKLLITLAFCTLTGMVMAQTLSGAIHTPVVIQQPINFVVGSRIPKIQSDTLYIPLGYKFIKVGDKVYRVITSLQEVKDEGVFIHTFPSTSLLNNNYK